jgi:dephospho-CoA kinase
VIVVGLTGSIGMGKSTVAAMFRRLRVPVFDADAAVHVLQGPDGAALAAIEAVFPGTTNAAGVDRSRLGAAVFGDAGALRRLEAIVHPLVGAAQRYFLRRHRRRPLVVLDIPLLFERGGAARVDVILVVSAPAAVQQERVLARTGMTQAKYAAILGQQLPDADKRARADIIIPTGRGRYVTWRAVRAVVACLSARQSR